MVGTWSGLLSGCSKETELPHVQVDDVALAKSKGVAQSEFLRCEPGKDCSESVALISAATSEGVKHCLGFLSDSDQIITSGLCLVSPGHPSGSVKDCADQVWVSFPETAGFESERVRCSSVESQKVSLPGIDSSYALLRLDRPLKRKPVALSSYGLLDQEQVKVFDLAAKSAGAEFTLIQKTCRVIHDSILIPGATSARSAVLVMSGCELSEASLGGPVLGREGSVRGIASRVFADSERLRLSLVTQDIPLFSDEFESASFVTNSACLKGGGRRNDIDYPECEFPLSGARAFEELNRKLKERSDQAVAMKARTWVRTAEPYFRYRTEKVMPNTQLGRALSRFTYDPGNLVSQHYQLPVCIEAKHEFLSLYQRNWPYFGGKYPETATYALVTPVWQVRMGVDSNTRFVYVTRPRRMPMPLQMEFNPSELAENGKTTVVITYKDELGENFELYRGDFALCFEN